MKQSVSKRNLREWSDCRFCNNLHKEKQLVGMQFGAKVLDEIGMREGLDDFDFLRDGFDSLVIKSGQPNALHRHQFSGVNIHASVHFPILTLANLVAPLPSKRYLGQKDGWTTSGSRLH